MTFTGTYRMDARLLMHIVLLWACCLVLAEGNKCSGKWAIHACAGGNGKRSQSRDAVELADVDALFGDGIKRSNSRRISPMLAALLALENSAYLRPDFNTVFDSTGEARSSGDVTRRRRR